MQQRGDDTIVALSSGQPPAAVAIIRTSGPAAFAAAQALAGPLPPPRQAALRDIARSPHTARRSTRSWSSASTGRHPRPAKISSNINAMAAERWSSAILDALACPAGHACCRAGRIHPPRLRQWPDRPDRGRGAGRPARGRDRAPAPRRPAAGRGRAAAAGRGLADSGSSCCRRGPKRRSIMSTMRTRPGLTSARWRARRRNWRTNWPSGSNDRAPNRSSRA